MQKFKWAGEKTFESNTITIYLQEIMGKKSIAND